jgi:hypothetical protein
MRAGGVTRRQRRRALPAAWCVVDCSCCCVCANRFTCIHTQVHPHPRTHIYSHTRALHTRTHTFIQVPHIFQLHNAQRTFVVARASQCTPVRCAARVCACLPDACVAGGPQDLARPDMCRLRRPVAGDTQWLAARTRGVSIRYRVFSSTRVWSRPQLARVRGMRVLPTETGTDEWRREARRHWPLPSNTTTGTGPYSLKVLRTCCLRAASVFDCAGGAILTSYTRLYLSNDKFDAQPPAECLKRHGSTCRYGSSSQTRASHVCELEAALF